MEDLSACNCDFSVVKRKFSPVFDELLSKTRPRLEYHNKLCILKPMFSPVFKELLRVTHAQLEYCFMMCISFYISEYKDFKNFIQVSKKAKDAILSRKTNYFGCDAIHLKLMYPEIETLYVEYISSLRDFIEFEIPETVGIVDLRGLDTFTCRRIRYTDAESFRELNQKYKVKIRNFAVKGYYHDKTLGDGEIDVYENKYANAVSVTKQGIIVYAAKKDQELINLLFSYFDAETDKTLFDD